MTFDFETYNNQISESDIENVDISNLDINTFLKNNDMTGWYDIDNLFNSSLIADVKNTASFIRNNCDVFIVIGIGGSYLGSLAVIEALNPYFYNQTNNPQIYFLGTSLSSEYYHDLIDLIKDKNVIVNVISKSGNTLETDITYELIMGFMRKKYSEEELVKRIIITTDKEKGNLRLEADKKGYKSFVIPNNIGGRYSVFTPVGLLPIAVSNIDIESIYKGAKLANENIDNQIKYALIRHAMYQKNKVVEAYTVYEPKLYALTEWLKQLYAESLGKEEHGILPISLINTRDLHSMGQFVQDGNKILFETVINVKNSNVEVQIDKYNKSLDTINNIASLATSKAHYNGNVSNNIITMDALNEQSIGYLMQFFMISCAISGFIEGVNPFNQDGVEEYKKIIKELL
jgi:glucose-6-phosphate isomerase